MWNYKSSPTPKTADIHRPGEKEGGGRGGAEIALLRVMRF